MKKALIAMSGGVDSSLAAKLTKDMGYDCIGCTMKLYNNEEACLSRERTCCSLEDAEDARSVAYRIGIPYYVFNFSQDFQEQVINRFVRAYEEGTTPNPCIDCNRYMKFDKLFNRAKVLGCDYIVTGHYARIAYDGTEYTLRKALDETKDQSYVLYTLTQEHLSRLLFPLGSMKKTEVRALAEKNGFINAQKADSQDICFVPDGDYASFIRRYTGKSYLPGDFLDINGKVLGKHAGIIHCTVGQRKGLGLALGQPMYVKRICRDDNTITLSENRHLFGRCLIAKDFHWISGSPPSGSIRCKVKIRYRQPEQDACVTPLKNGTVRMVFDRPLRAISVGQAAVLYDGDVVLGGGVIDCAE